MDVAHALERHAENMIGLGVGLIRVRGIHRKPAGADDVAFPPRLDGALEHGVRLAPGKRRLDFFVQGFKFGERFELGVHADKRVQGRGRLRERHGAEPRYIPRHTSLVMFNPP